MAKSLANKILPKSVKNEVMRTIEPHLRLRANGKGVCSAKMRLERRQTIMMMVAQLWSLGFRIRKLESLSVKHVEALMAYWHSQEMSAGTLHTRLSMLRVLCGWMRKENVVKDITDYLPAEVVQRSTVAKKSKAWDAKQVDPLEIIELAKKVDERFACMLSLQHHFGLRVKESIEIRPANSVVEGGAFIELHEGTKGGKPRRIPVDDPGKVEAIAWARRIASTGNTKRLRWTDCTWRQAQNRFYHFARQRMGISKAGLGITAHGLRHGFCQRDYKRQTGLPTPIEGGALGRIDRELHQMASITTSRALGHGRIDVTTGYYGSYGHRLRQAPVKVTYSFSFNPETKTPDK